MSLVSDPRVMGDSPVPTIVKVTFASTPGPFDVTGTGGKSVVSRPTAFVSDNLPSVLLNSPAEKISVSPSVMRSPLTTSTPCRTRGL